MTELNHSALEAEISWPVLNHSGHRAGVGLDPVVARAMKPIEELPELAVADHAERLAATHDALLAALNEDPAAMPSRTMPDALRPGGH